MHAATSTGVQAANGVTNRSSNATVTDVEPTNATTEEKLKATPPLQKKYRHVAAVHAQTRPSCLSHDAQANPSFLGFRNLMVIVLGKQLLDTP
jgi:diacylglycerol O-acyltransferase-1